MQYLLSLICVDTTEYENPKLNVLKHTESQLYIYMQKPSQSEGLGS